MASARKRPRAEPEDNRAECPFTIKIVDPKDKEQKKKKRRRTENGDEEDTAQRINLQMSPFAPSGKFKTHETMDLFYQVDPPKRWTDMTRYNSFVRKFKLPRLRIRACAGSIVGLTYRSAMAHSQRDQVLQRGFHLRRKRLEHRAPEGRQQQRADSV